MTDAETSPSAPVRPTFILDVPATEDELGAHGRVADAIFNVVRDDHRIKTIGLLGGWGSGKSTVVRLVEEAVSRNGAGEQIHCFTYDAWLHQSDPPRRAFLEALVTFFQQRPAFEDLHTVQPDWRSKLDGLNKQTETTETTTTPTLTAAGLWFLPTLLFLPLGVKLIGDGTIAWDAQPAEVCMFALGWLLTLAPALVALGIYVAWRPDLPIRDRRYWTTHRAPHQEQSILSVVANKHVETKRELKAKSTEPTAIEFQEAFREILSAALTKDRRLLIVVDNLDRLPAEEAMKIWATIRSFFLGGDGASPKLDRANLPTVIVPIDEGSIGKIHGNSEDGSVSRSFLEKTFDLVFHVPGPVLSRWHRYLRQRLVEVFGPGMPSEWPYEIGTVYEAWLGRSGTQPTPRAINSFANGLAIVWMQLRGEPVHIGVVAHFVTERATIARGIHQAVQGENPLLDRFDPEWRPSIAALHYGVGLADAGELFMEAPIRSAIEGADTAGFAELAAVPGFDRYFLKVLSDEANPDEPLWVYGAAGLLARLPPQRDPWVPEAWRALRRLSVATLHRRPYAAGDDAGLLALIESCDTAELPLFLRSLASALEGLPPEAVQLDQAAPFAEAARIVVERSHAVGMDDLSIGIPGGPQVFAQLLRHDLRPEVTRALEPSSGAPAVLGYLGERLRDPIMSGSTHRVAQNLALRGPADLDWEPLLDTATHIMQQGEVVLVSSAAGLMRALYAHVSSVPIRVATWLHQGVLAHAFGVAWNSGVDQAVAEVAALGMKVDATLSPPDGRGWDAKLAELPEIPRLLEAAFREIGAPLELGWLVQRARVHPSEVPLLRAMAGRLLEDGTTTAPVPSTVLGDPEGYSDVLPAELRSSFWCRVADQKDFWTTSESLPTARLAPVLHAILSSDVNKAGFGKALQKRLHSTPAAEWDTALRQGSEPLPLVQALDSLDRSSVTIGPEALNALRAASSDVLSSTDESFRRRWFALAARLSHSNRKTLFKILRDLLASGAAVTDLRSLLLVGGSPLLIEGEFQKAADGSVVHLVLPLISVHDGPSWLIEHIDEVRGWVARSDASTRATLTEQLEARRSAGDGQAGELLKGFGATLAS